MLHVFGDVNLSNAAALYSEVLESSLPDKMLVLDLSECRYIDPMICTTLLRAHKALGGSFRVIAAPSSDIEVFMKNDPELSSDLLG